MPSCRKCGADFPNRIRIDGKWRTLNRRKYCLACSPFGIHNTKCLVGSDGRRSGEGDRIESPCERCGKAVEAYREGRAICQSCKITAVRIVHKLMAIKILGSVCAKCGWSGSPAGFSFHHESSDKESALGRMFGSRSWSAIQAELEKCSLVCTRCHGILHSSRYEIDSVVAAVHGLDLSSMYLDWLSDADLDRLHRAHRSEAHMKGH
jgi:hypothetical protein